MPDLRIAHAVGNSADPVTGKSTVAFAKSTRKWPILLWASAVERFIYAVEAYSVTSRTSRAKWQGMWTPLMETPIELKRSLPRIVLEFADRRLVVLYALAIYGPLLYLGSIDNLYVWDAIGPPTLGPILAAVYLTFRPMNPYDWAWVERRTSEARSDDPVAQRLLRLLRSNTARKIVWTTALVTSVALCFFAYLASVVVSSGSQSRNSDLFNNSLYSGLWALLSSSVIYHFLLRWAFREWQSA
jgi:hypothetical protein